MIVECFNYNEHAAVGIIVNDTSTSLIQNFWWF